LIVKKLAPAGNISPPFQFHNVRPDEQAGNLSAVLFGGATREKGFSVETWTENGFSYAVVSDASGGDVHALSELLRAAGRS
jgi:hypothetical protein